MNHRLMKDQMGRDVYCPLCPQKIVSLVPSQTELLYDLGLGDRVVGITKFCIHPTSWYISKKRIGGTKNVDIAAVSELKPDLIIGNKEENTEKDIKDLQEIAPVWMSDVYNLPDALDMIRLIGGVCSKQHEAEQLVKKISNKFALVKPGAVKNTPSVLYLIWKKPYMGAASCTFINYILEEHLGFLNVLGEKKRYPAIELKDFKGVDFIFLSTEPFPFKETHVKELQLQFPTAKIILVDGEYFSWYGSRLKDAPSYFRQLQSELGLEF